MDIIDKGKLSYSLLQNMNVSNMPNLTGLLTHTHTKKRYYKVINLSSWTPQLCFIKNDVIVHYFLDYFKKIHFFPPRSI